MNLLGKELIFIQVLSSIFIVHLVKDKGNAIFKG